MVNNLYYLTVEGPVAQHGWSVRLIKECAYRHRKVESSNLSRPTNSGVSQILYIAAHFFFLRCEKMSARRPWEILLKVEGWKSGYTSVDRLLRHLIRKTKSEGSRATYLKTLSQFVRFTDLSPEQLVVLEKEQIEENVQAFCDLARAPRTANRKMEELKTFFKYNGFRTGNKCNLILERHYIGVRERSRPEYIPTEEEIQAILNEAGLNLKWRALFYVTYTTGLRSSTLRAVKYGDIRKEVEADVSPLLVRVYPEMKKIIPEACKNKIPYFTFISKDAVDAVKTYVADREIRLGPLEDDQILFCSDNRRIKKEKRPYSPLDMTAPEKMIRKAAKAARIREWRHVTPHCLRKAFERALRNSSLNTKDQEFLMGHILPGSQDTYYDFSKVEDLKIKYAGIRFFRTTEVDKLEMIKAFAKTLGIANIEIKIQKIREEEPKVTDEEAVGRIIKEELGIKPLEMRPAKYRKENSSTDCIDNCKRYESKLVSEDQLMPYVDGGWDIIKEFRNGKIVIRRELV